MYLVHKLAERVDDFRAESGSDARSTLAPTCVRCQPIDPMEAVSGTLRDGTYSGPLD
jgi:hypothetical protein